MKKKILVVFSIVFSLTIMSQSKNDVAKAYFNEALANYSNGEYYKALNRLKKAEETLGDTNARILNLKIKCYYDWGLYTSAKNTLSKFSDYSENASTKLKDETFAYIVKIEDAIINKRLEEIKKRRKDSIAKIKKEKEQKKLDKILHEFEHRTCSECSGSGRESYNKYRDCNYISYTNYGTIKGKCNGKGWYQWGDLRVTCPKCKGTGDLKSKSTRTCSVCNGKKKVLKYTGYPKISSYDESKYIKENRYTIERYIKEKKQKEYQRKREREREIANKKEALKQTLKKRTLTDRIYFDDKRNEVLSKYSAKFYREPQKKVNGLYHIKDYSVKTKKLVLEAYSSQVASLTSAHLRGIVNWYYSSSSKGVSSSYDGRLQSQQLYDDLGHKKITFNYYASNQNKVKIEFFNTSKSIFNTGNHGIIDGYSIQKYDNGFPKYLKWTYIGSKKKYNKYYIFNMSKNGDLLSRQICNKKWKVKKTITY